MICRLLILAEGQPVTRRAAMEALRKGFNTELASNEMLVYIVGGVALIALVLLLSQIIGQRKRPKPAPRRDYLAEAVKVLGLSREERSDLLELAARARLPQPAAMLLSPANLAFALSRAPTDGPAGPLRNRLDTLARKLFGEGLPGDARRGTAPARQSVSSTADGSQPV
jgi:hypothetical protein